MRRQRVIDHRPSQARILSQLALDYTRFGVISGLDRVVVNQRAAVAEALASICCSRCSSWSGGM